MAVQYATAAEFEVYGLPPAALEGAPAELDLDDHLTKASGLADSFTRGRYGELVEPYPPELVAAVCQLAAYTVLNYVGFDPESNSDRNVRQRYDDAMAWLTLISDGKASLAVTADGTPTTAEGGPRVRSRRRRGPRGGYSSDDCDDDSEFWGNC